MNGSRKLDVKGVPFSQKVQKGLAVVTRTHEVLVNSLVGALASLREDRAAALLKGEFKGLGDFGFSAPDAQVMSCYFQLLNIAEEYAASQAKTDREVEAGACVEPGHWGSYLARLREAEVSPARVRERLADLEVEPVFTKHPTEAKRWSVLRIHREILNVIRQRYRARTEFDLESANRKLDALMERLWMTGEVYSKKPTVQDELQNLLYYLTEVIPPAQACLDARLRHAWSKTWPDERPLDKAELPRTRLGSWVGGDRDGHPFVTAEVTRETLGELRRNALRLVKERLELLGDKLSFTAGQTPAPEELIDALRADWGNADTDVEPWHRFVNLTAAELESGGLGLLGDRLTQLRGWLVEAGATRLAAEEVETASRFSELIGLHLARMDVRQNSAYYERALVQLLALAGVEQAQDFGLLSDAQKRVILDSELANPRPLSRPEALLGEEAKEVLAYLRVLRDQIGARGKASLGTLIVSMTRNAEDLLTVYLLSKEAGLFEGEGEDAVCPLVVTPLFETYDDLLGAPAIMRDYLSHGLVRRSLPVDRSGSPYCMVMLGYSDSNKDVGILASQWALHATQEKLLAIGSDMGIGMQFFHGRGGTVSRGAGPTHRFLEALPQGALDRGLRLTEQGEVIGQKYNSLDSASSQLETLLAGSLGAGLLAERRSENPQLAIAMNALSHYSKTKYRALLEKEGFMRFYRQATPIDAIELSRIGSRPSRRTGQPTLEDLRAIPWVFSWNQSRFYLPGWYGVGTALRALRENRDSDYQFLHNEIQTCPFVRYVLYNVESSLASSDAKWMTRYASLVMDSSIREDFLGTILEERTRAEEELQALFGKSLKERRPRFWSTLEAREHPLGVLHQQQIERLREFRAGESLADDQDKVESLLLLINAIASGLRTTG